MGKLEELLQKRDEIKQKLAEKMLGYRGVAHESAISEMKDQEVKVLKAHLEEIEKEIGILTKKTRADSSAG